MSIVKNVLFIDKMYLYRLKVTFYRKLMYVLGRYQDGPPGPGRQEEPEPGLDGAGRGRSGLVGAAGPDAYVIPNRQGSLISPMELEYRKNSQVYRQKVLFYRLYRRKGDFIDKTAPI